MSNTDLQQAAATVAAAELSALNSLKTILADAAAKVDAVVADLSYPAGFPSNAQRVATNLKMSLQWPAQDVDQQLAALNPPPAPASIVPPLLSSQS